MNAKRLTAIAVVAIAGSLVLLQAIAAPPAGTKKAEVGAPAPGFSLPDTYGKTFTLSEFKGKTVVLEWVNQKCPISRGKHEDKTMQTTYAKYAAKGVVWLGIDSSHYLKAESNRVYAAEKHLNYPILHDPDGKVGRAYGAKTTPHMFVVDKEGKLTYDGAIDDKSKTNYVAAALDSLLAGKPIAKRKTEPYGCSVKYAPKGPAR